MTDQPLSDSVRLAYLSLAVADAIYALRKGEVNTKIVREQLEHAYKLYGKQD